MRIHAFRKFRKQCVVNFQEEIKLCTCPELMAAMMFVESLQDNEALVIEGFEQFSVCTGYADSLQFAGHCDGQAEVSSDAINVWVIDRPVAGDCPCT